MKNILNNLVWTDWQRTGCQPSKRCEDASVVGERRLYDLIFAFTNGLPRNAPRFKNTLVFLLSLALFYYKRFKAFCIAFLL